MILFWMIATPLMGGLTAWLVSRWSAAATRWISLAAMTIVFALALALWAQSPQRVEIVGGGAWLVQLKWPWIPSLGISFHLAADGLSLIMVALTGFLGVLSVAASWTSIKERVGFFHLNLMWVLAGVIGVFLAMDLFLFYFFWELMLVPMYFLIDIWGHENRHYAAIKFFLFTQLSGLLMLLAILGLYFVHARAAGFYSFDYGDLLGTHMSSGVATWLMLGFFAAFAVKLPVFPLHTWLPDAHTEAPTAGSVVLAGLLLKTGAYGMLRFIVPLFPGPAMTLAPIFMALGIVGILYGAVLAFAQTDLKRLIAYTSVSHLGFVLVGVFAWNLQALQGTMMQMVCHGVSTGALFILVGVLQDRIHTRDLGRMGGLWAVVPRMGAAAMFFALASLGLPGMGNFVAEFLVLLGSYQVSVAITAVATVGLVAATVYALYLMQAAFLGPMREQWKLPDLGIREMAIMIVMMIALVWLGLFPQTVLDMAGTALDGLLQAAQWTGAAAGPAAGGAL